jgi:hypothetical protein
MLYPLANFANLLMWGLVVLGATWAYVKYRYKHTYTSMLKINLACDETFVMLLQI